MIKLRKGSTVALALSALMLALMGCQKQGPAETAGKKIDQTTQKAGEKIQKAGDNIQDAVKGD